MLANLVTASTKLWSSSMMEGNARERCNTSLVENWRRNQQEGGKPKASSSAEASPARYHPQGIWESRAVCHQLGSTPLREEIPSQKEKEM